MHKDTFWKKRKHNKLQCFLCSHFCTLSDANFTLLNQNNKIGQNYPNTGKCRVRKNMNGQLESLISHKIASYNIDPVEKKPLYHFLPTTKTFSIGTMGCNFDCAWCQNSSIAHPISEKNARLGTQITAQNIMDTCKKYHCPSLSFTYNEPTVFFELMLDCAQKAQEENIKTIMVSNGYQSTKALNYLLPLIHAANIDLKSFSNNTYQKYCNALLKPVLNTLKTIAKSHTWLEVTTLLIPNLNDTKEELQNIAKFIYNELGDSVPWHISAFYPQRNMLNTPPTSKDSLIKAFEIGKENGLKHVYVGNAGIQNTTQCPHCHEKLIIRDVYSTKFSSIIEEAYKIRLESNIRKNTKNLKKIPLFDGVCPTCHAKLDGIW